LDRIYPEKTGKPLANIRGDIVEPTLQSYAYTYAGKGAEPGSSFWDRFYQDPLGPLLDAATAISLGSTGTIRAAQIATRAGKLSPTNRLFTAGRTDTRPDLVVNPNAEALPEGVEAGRVSRPYSRYPIRKAGQVAVDYLGRNVAPLGRFQTGRAVKRQQREGYASELAGEAAAVRTNVDELVQTMRPLSANEQEALAYASRGINTPEFIAANEELARRSLANENPEGGNLFNFLGLFGKRGHGKEFVARKANLPPEIKELILKPTPAMVRAHQAIEKQVEIGREKLGVDPELHAARVAQPQNILLDIMGRGEGPETPGGPSGTPPDVPPGRPGGGGYDPSKPPWFPPYRPGGPPAESSFPDMGGEPRNIEPATGDLQRHLEDTINEDYLGSTGEPPDPDTSYEPPDQPSEDIEIRRFAPEDPVMQGRMTAGEQARMAWEDPAVADSGNKDPNTNIEGVAVYLDFPSESMLDETSQLPDPRAYDEGNVNFFSFTSPEINGDINGYGNITYFGGDFNFHIVGSPEVQQHLENVMRYWHESFQAARQEMQGPTGPPLLNSAVPEISQMPSADIWQEFARPGDPNFQRAQQLAPQFEEDYGPFRDLALENEARNREFQSGERDPELEIRWTPEFEDAVLDLLWTEHNDLFPEKEFEMGNLNQLEVGGGTMHNVFDELMDGGIYDWQEFIKLTLDFADDARRRMNLPKEEPERGSGDLTISLTEDVPSESSDIWNQFNEAGPAPDTPTSEMERIIQDTYGEWWEFQREVRDDPNTGATAGVDATGDMPEGFFLPRAFQDTLEYMLRSTGNEHLIDDHVAFMGWAEDLLADLKTGQFTTWRDFIDAAGDRLPGERINPMDDAGDMASESMWEEFLNTDTASGMRDHINQFNEELMSNPIEEILSRQFGENLERMTSEDDFGDAVAHVLEKDGYDLGEPGRPGEFTEETLNEVIQAVRDLLLTRGYNFPDDPDKYNMRSEGEYMEFVNPEGVEGAQNPYNSPSIQEFIDAVHEIQAPKRLEPPGEFQDARDAFDEWMGREETGPPSDLPGLIQWYSDEINLMDQAIEDELQLGEIDETTLADMHAQRAQLMDELEQLIQRREDETREREAAAEQGREYRPITDAQSLRDALVEQLQGLEDVRDTLDPAEYQHHYDRITQQLADVEEELRNQAAQGFEGLADQAGLEPTPDDQIPGEWNQDDIDRIMGENPDIVAGEGLDTPMESESIWNQFAESEPIPGPEGKQDFSTPPEEGAPGAPLFNQVNQPGENFDDFLRAHEIDPDLVDAEEYNRLGEMWTQGYMSMDSIDDLSNSQFYLQMWKEQYPGVPFPKHLTNSPENTSLGFSSRMFDLQDEGILPEYSDPSDPEIFRKVAESFFGEPGRQRRIKEVEERLSQLHEGWQQRVDNGTEMENGNWEEYYSREISEYEAELSELLGQGRGDFWDEFNRTGPPQPREDFGFGPEEFAGAQGREGLPSFSDFLVEHGVYNEDMTDADVAEAADLYEAMYGRPPGGSGVERQAPPVDLSTFAEHGEGGADVPPAVPPSPPGPGEPPPPREPSVPEGYPIRPTYMPNIAAAGFEPHEPGLLARILSNKADRQPFIRGRRERRMSTQGVTAANLFSPRRQSYLQESTGETFRAGVWRTDAKAFVEHVARRERDLLEKAFGPKMMMQMAAKGNDGEPLRFRTQGMVTQLLGDNWVLVHDQFPIQWFPAENQFLMQTIAKLQELEESGAMPNSVAVREQLEKIADDNARAFVKESFGAMKLNGVAIPRDFYEYQKKLVTASDPYDSAPMRVLARYLHRWRTLTLAYMPRWAVNTGVGSLVLNSIKGVGPRDYSLSRQLKQKGVFGQERMAGVELGNVSGMDYLEPGQQGLTDRATGVHQTAVSERIVSKVQQIEDYFRRASFVQSLKYQHKQRLREMGQNLDNLEIHKWDYNDMEFIDKLLGDEDLMKATINELNQFSYNFAALGPSERRVVRTFIPFWGWYKFISKFAWRLPVEHPLRANLLAQLGLLGAMSQDELGAMPEWLRGVIPLDLQKGELTYLSTFGINPFAQFFNPLGPEGAVQGTVQVGQASPPIQALLSAIGMDPLRGGTAPISPESNVGQDYFGAYWDIAHGTETNIGREGAGRRLAMGLLRAAPQVRMFERWDAGGRPTYPESIPILDTRPMPVREASIRRTGIGESALEMFGFLPKRFDLGNYQRQAPKRLKYAEARNKTQLKRLRRTLRNP
jgi:hypothetical protein